VATPQSPADVAIAQANIVMQFCQQIRTLQVAIQGVLTYNTSNPLGTSWSALNTAATAADGQLGTADGTVNTAHVIDGRVYANLNRDVSETALAQALQVLVDFNSFCNGSALSANASRPGQLNAVVI
jgi:hypothetical protein